MSLEEILENLTKELLEELLDGHKIKYKKGLPKAKLADFVAEKSERKGTEQLFAALNKSTLKSALTDLDKTPDHDSHTKMLKEFKELWKKQGLVEILEALKLDTLKQIASDLSFEVESEKKEDYVEQIGDEVDILGVRKFFSIMSKAYAEDCCDALKLSKKGSKNQLIDRILSQAFPHLSDEEKSKGKRERKTSGKTSRVVDYSIIKKGIDYTTLFQEFYHHELVKFCKDNKIKTSGKRREVVNRILKWLEGDDKAKVGTKKRKRKAMSEALKKKKRKEKAKEAKEKKEKEEGKGEKEEKKKDEKPARKKRRTKKQIEEDRKKAEEEKKKEEEKKDEKKEDDKKEEKKVEKKEEKEEKKVEKKVEKNEEKEKNDEKKEEEEKKKEDDKKKKKKKTARRSSRRRG